MIAEPRLESIFDQSPYTNIRAEAYDFLEDSGRVDTLSLSKEYLLEGTLNQYLTDVQQHQPSVGASIFSSL